MRKLQVSTPVFTLGLIFSCITLFSCQKELDSQVYHACLPETIEVFENNNATAAETYSYVYDPVTLWPQTITINVPASTYSKILDIIVTGNTIRLGSVGVIEMDNAKRVTHLTVTDAFPGAEKGDYFYGYDSQGFLAERLFDDGGSMVERAVFTNDGAAIDSLTISYVFDPDKLLGDISYLPATNGSGENLLPYTDVFPELLPFAYLVKLGRISLEIPDKMKVLFESPGMPTATLNYQYSGYQFDANKLLTGFSSQLTLPGNPAYKRSFSISYVCQ